MEAIVEKKVSFSELTKDLKIFPQILINVSVTDKNLAMSDEEVLAEAAAVEKELGDTGRLLLRQSGTENLVRVMVEAETDEICKAMAERVVEKIKAKYC